MKTLIVYTSVHHQNTEKVAKVMAEELQADLIPVAKAQPGMLASYDLVGSGSGIYFGKHHKTLLQFVETLPPVTQKRACVFSTCGDGKIHHAALKEKLVNRGFSVMDEFCCKGWDTVGPLKLWCLRVSGVYREKMTVRLLFWPCRSPFDGFNDLVSCKYRLNVENNIRHPSQYRRMKGFFVCFGKSIPSAGITAHIPVA
jgi:flavodoxin